MKKLFACLLALSIAFALAACGKDEPVDAVIESTTAEIETIEHTTMESTAIESTTIESMTTENTVTETTAEGASTISPAVPTDMAGIVAYYNAALEKTGMRRVSYKRTMTKIAARAAFGILNEENLQDDPGVAALGNMDESKIAPSDLIPLRAEWVGGASSSVSGDTATLTIRLKERALDPGDTAFNPRPGTNGYVSTVDKPTAEQLVIDSAMALSGGILSRVDVTRTAFGLAGGVYTIAVDTKTGTIKSLRFSVTQSADGEAKCRVSIVPLSVSASVNMRWDITAAYMPVQGGMNG